MGRKLVALPVALAVALSADVRDGDAEAFVANERDGGGGGGGT